MQGAPRVDPPPSRPWVILFVDDEPDILTSLSQLMEVGIKGVRVITAASGREGLELLDKERVDLVLSDFKMPGMDGIEFLYQCRRQHPTVPRMMMTAFASPELAQRALVDALVRGFLSKADEPKRMLETVRNQLGYVPGEAVAV